MSPAAQKAAAIKTKQMLANLELSALRKAAKCTQAQVAKMLGVSQAAVAKLESRPDIQLSTLARYAKSMGAKLKLIAEMPNGQEIRVL
jgi:transcriptional regulator with XRE-family HTH domain